MTDPYEVLGIKPTATDSEVKTAYKELVRKYHPDRHQGNPLAEVAAEKMTQINAAYDQIMNERRSGSYGYGSYDSSQSSGTSSGYSSGYSGGYYDRTYDGSRDYSFDHNYIRQLLTAGNVTQAEELLNAVPSQGRTAEWYFLMGSVCYKRGWLNDAYSNFSRAYQLQPGNREYADAVSRMNTQRSGFMKGNPTRGTGSPVGSNFNADEACDCISKIVIADCCCECLGGDLVPCC